MQRQLGLVSLATMLSFAGGPLVLFATVIGTNLDTFQNRDTSPFAVFLRATPTPTPTPTPSPTPTPTPTPSPTPTPKPTATPTPKPTATPTPLPTAPPPSLNQLESWFTQYAGHYSVDRELLRKIAYCESKFNSLARNGPYGGLFQFHSGTWSTNRGVMGLDSNPELRYNPEEAIRTAAFVISTRGAGAWPNCSRR